MNHHSPNLCPVRPEEIHSDLGIELDEGYEDLEHGPAQAEVGDKVRVQDEAEIDADNGDVYEVPRPHPEPRPPTARERAKHFLTHFPYISWCKHCVAGRRNNVGHYASNPDERTIPSIHLDFCFLRDSRDQDLLTCLVGRLTPSQAVFACPCDVKGADPYTVHRLNEFFKCTGVPHLVCKSDQESAIGSMVDEALVQLRRTAEHQDLVAVPELSAVGESQSNGIAERTVQAFEDDLRTLKSAFEERIGARLISTHPVLKWLVEHAASLRTRFAVTKNRVTAYEHLHGRKANDKIIEFGERVFYFVPRRLRSKLNLKWKIGIYLGAGHGSNESYVGTFSGDVIKARGLVRVVEGSRWHHEAIGRITCTPAKRNPSGNTEYERVEDSEQPHANLDDSHDQKHERLDDPQVQDALSKRVRVTQADFKNYGYSDNCPRCADLQAGHNRTNKPHTEACRLRIYGEFEANDPVK